VKVTTGRTTYSTQKTVKAVASGEGEVPSHYQYTTDTLEPLLRGGLPGNSYAKRFKLRPVIDYLNGE
jgi:hypothetical protein